MKHRWSAGGRQLMILAVVLLLAAALAGCTTALGASGEAVTPEPTATVRYVPTLEGAMTGTGWCGGYCTPTPQQTPEATGYVPSAADAAISSGSCGGVCYGYTGSSDVSPVPSPYAGGGCVVGRADNTPSTNVCDGQCDEDCDCDCADEGCTANCANAVPVGPCGVAQPECTCDCSCVN